MVTLLIMSLNIVSDGSSTITPEFSLSECFKLAQNFPHLNKSSMLFTTTVSASRYTTAKLNFKNQTVKRHAKLVLIAKKEKNPHLMYLEITSLGPL